MQDSEICAACARSSPSRKTCARHAARRTGTPASAFIRETLGVFVNMTEQTFSGVYSTASKDTQWLSLDNYAALVCGNTFKSSEIAGGKKDVFINIPASILRSYPGIGRVIIGSLINAMIEADGAFTRRALFILDEVDLLGYMRVLEEARDRGRKYGVSMMLMYQSVGQLERHFRKRRCGVVDRRLRFRELRRDQGTGYRPQRLSPMWRNDCRSQRQFSQSRLGYENSASRKSENINFQRRPLIMPHEITQSMRKDEQIIIVQGHSPIRCGRAIYFRRKDMDMHARPNRFAKLGP